MNCGMVPTKDLEEALRWCFRHSAVVDFFGDADDGRTYCRLITPIRGVTPKRVDRVTVLVPNHDLTGETFCRLVSAVRTRLKYE
jgi:hypothetical protein